MLAKILRTSIPLLVMIYLADSVFAEVHLSTTSYYQVSKEEIIGGVTICSDGNVMLFSRFINKNSRSRLIILSPEAKLLEERFFEFDMPVFLKEINGKKLMGFIQENKTNLRFIDDGYEWVFPEMISNQQTHSINKSIYLVGTYLRGDNLFLFLRKIFIKGCDEGAYIKMQGNNFRNNSYYIVFDKFLRR